MIIKKTNITPIKIQPARFNKNIYFTNSHDEFVDCGFDKNILLSKGILNENEDLNYFFNDVSYKIFNKKNDDFINALKNKEISLSTSAYANLDYPHSAVGIELDKDMSDAVKLSVIDEQTRKGLGIGINFSDFENPANEVLKINKYLKFLEPKTKRPPALMGILDINHPKILDFITLKDNKDYENWCADLSVIINDDFMKKLDNNDKNTQKIYSTLLNSMQKSGEPGIIFSNNKNYLCDCCGAVSLNKNEKFTIGQINLSKFYKNNKINYDKLKKDTEILSSVMYKLDKNSYVGILGYQDLLNKMGINYGSKEAINLINPIMKIIQNSAHKHNLKTAISPTGNTSRFLRTTPSIEPNESDYKAEIATMTEFQKYLDGNISKTFLLDKNSTLEDIDNIIKSAYKNDIKGFTVYNKSLSDKY